jgi:(1->4)-alpha-D-glucan 1-alpha-D-glucosylmutase
MRWQQFTGRVMAKGVEDTAFYNYNRLISLNEVGGEPGRSGEDSIRRASCTSATTRIARDWPHTMNATSTHDTKRAEDVRARMHVLSEIPARVGGGSARWTRERLAQTRRRPAFERGVADLSDARRHVAARRASSRASPNGCARISRKPRARRRRIRAGSRRTLITNARCRTLHGDRRAPAVPRARSASSSKRIAFHGFLNSLAQVVLKACSAGLPDFYQGSELWDFSLVDPDNRRPVDYEKRASLLRDLPPPSTLLEHWTDGRIKLFVTARSLAARAKHIDAFRGAYRPISTNTRNAIAFTRGDDILVVVPRLTAQLVQSPQLPIGDVWGDRAIEIDGRWRNVFTDEVVEGGQLKEVFATFPVAILERA